MAVLGRSGVAAASSSGRAHLVWFAVRRAGRGWAFGPGVRAALSPPARGAGDRPRLLGLRGSGERHRAATGREPARRHADGGGAETVRQVRLVYGALFAAFMS